MLKKHKFKPGDKVRIIAPNAPTKENFETNFPKINSEKQQVPSQNDILTIDRICYIFSGDTRHRYRVLEDNGMFVWDEDWLDFAQTKLALFLDDLNISEKQETTENEKETF